MAKSPESTRRTACPLCAWGWTAGPGRGPLRRQPADIVHISPPSHHYPTGIVTPIARRRELLRWAEESRSAISRG